ncbi:hypothetical protein [Streptomyces griseofuscus]|nr:hypothetical protein [Streptomyces griseofuscus]
MRPIFLCVGCGAVYLPPENPEHIPHWSTWRRRRQHQARTSHYKRRGHSP